MPHVTTWTAGPCGVTRKSCCESVREPRQKGKIEDRHDNSPETRRGSPKDPLPCGQQLPAIRSLDYHKHAYDYLSPLAFDFYVRASLRKFVVAGSPHATLAGKAGRP